MWEVEFWQTQKNPTLEFSGLLQVEWPRLELMTVSGGIVFRAWFFLICAALSSVSLWSDLTLRTSAGVGWSDNTGPGGVYHADIGFGESVVFLFLRDRNGQGILGLPSKGTLTCLLRIALPCQRLKC